MTSIRNPTGRRTECRIVRFGVIEFFFSYETLMGVCFPGGAFRRGNSWGPTTGRHLREMGIDGWPVLGEIEFEHRVHELETLTVVNSELLEDIGRLAMT